MQNPNLQSELSKSSVQGPKFRKTEFSKNFPRTPYFPYFPYGFLIVSLCILIFPLFFLIVSLPFLMIPSFVLYFSSSVSIVSSFVHFVSLCFVMLPFFSLCLLFYLLFTGHSRLIVLTTSCLDFFYCVFSKTIVSRQLLTIVFT